MLGDIHRSLSPPADISVPTTVCEQLSDFLELQTGR